jgi:hypothetical protein
MSQHQNRPWQQAASLAARFHQGQVRKDGKTPYIAHPFRVAMTVRDVFGVDDPVALAAALLHDVIEDTTADYDDLNKHFGAEVADVVAALTKDMRMPESLREAAYDRQLAAAAWQARLVKLADVYDNVSDCLDGVMRKKAVEKARRAVAHAGSEPRVKAAARQVELLMDGPQQTGQTNHGRFGARPLVMASTKASSSWYVGACRRHVRLRSTRSASYTKFQSSGSFARQTSHWNQPSFTMFRSPHASHRRKIQTLVNPSGRAMPARTSADSTAGHDSGSGQ